MRILKTTLGAAFALATGIIGNASASPIVPTWSYSCAANTCAGSATTGASLTDFTAQFDIPKFDTSLGILTDILITVNGGMNATASVTNSGATTATGVLVTQNTTVTTATGPVIVAGSGGLATITGGSNGGSANLTFTLSTNAAGAATSAAQPAGHVLAGDTVTGIVLANTFATQTLHQTSGFDTNLFGLGGGTFSIIFATGEYTNMGGSGGNLTPSVGTNDTISMNVQYLYNDFPCTENCVPEPASMSLLGLGLVGLGAVARRRRAAK